MFVVNDDYEKDNIGDNSHNDTVVEQLQRKVRVVLQNIHSLNFLISLKMTFRKSSSRIDMFGNLVSSVKEYYSTDLYCFCSCWSIRILQT